MKNLKIIIIIQFLFLCNFSGNNLIAFENLSVRTNYEIIDSLLNLYTDNFHTNSSIHKGESIRLQITPHPADWLLKDKLIRLLTQDSCGIINDSGKKTDFSFQLNINYINVKYLLNDQSGDSLNREISIYLSGIKQINDRIEPFPEYKISYNDMIGKDNIDIVNSKQYDFASSYLPQKENTFFEEIVEPVILITSTVVAVVLLFMVRSN